MKEALAIAESIEEKTHRDLALLSVVGGCLRAADRAGAQAAADKLQTDTYKAAARLALLDGPGDRQDYQAVAHERAIRWLARIQVQTPGRDRAAMLRWIQATPRSDHRYYALLGAAEGILATQRPAAPPATDGASTQPAAKAADIEGLIRRLGGETSAQREAAQRALVGIGAAALPALRATSRDKNSERAVRAKRALASIQRYDRIPETVSQVLLKTYVLGKRAPVASPPPLPAEEFHIMGEVDRPGAYSLAGRKTTVKMALAGAGFAPGKKKDWAVVLTRRLRDGSEQQVVLNIDALIAGEQRDVLLRNGDVVAVRPIKEVLSHFGRTPASAPAAPQGHMGAPL